MRTLLLIAALASAASANAAQRRYSVRDFDKVEVSGPYRVTLATGVASSAVATGSQLALDRVSVEVQGRTLRVRPNRSAWGGYPGEAAGPVTLRLTTRNLASAIVEGSGSLAIDKARGLKLELAVGGTGTLEVLGIEADTLNLALLGSGRITLAGQAKKVRAALRGTGDLAARDFKAEDAEIISETAGGAVMEVVRAAKVTARASGDVEIIGTPACTVEASGAGQVSCN
jgi:hypothetical protein